MSDIKDNEIELDIKICSAVEQGKALKIARDEIAAFKKLSKVEQNRVLMKEFREQNPVKRSKKAIKLFLVK